MDNNLIPLGIDAGNGAFKLYGAAGGLELVSQVATNGTQKVLSPPWVCANPRPRSPSITRMARFTWAQAHTISAARSRTWM